MKIKNVTISSASCYCIHNPALQPLLPLSPLLGGWERTSWRYEMVPAQFLLCKSLLCTKMHGKKRALTALLHCLSLDINLLQAAIVTITAFPTTFLSRATVPLLQQWQTCEEQVIYTLSQHRAVNPLPQACPQQETDVEEYLIRTGHKAMQLPPCYTPGSSDPVKRELSMTATWRYLGCFLPPPSPQALPQNSLCGSLAGCWGSNLLHPKFHLYQQLGLFCKQFVSTRARWLRVWALLLYRRHSVSLLSEQMDLSYYVNLKNSRLPFN